MNHRTLGSLVVLVSILILPYWVYLPILFLAMLLFPFFWEGILFAFLIETIYGHGSLPPLSFSLVSPFAVSILMALIIILLLRENFRSYV